jgi:hypothetical protein
MQTVIARHILHAGHFALDDATDEIACLVRSF